MLLRRAGQLSWARALVLTLLSACATETQDPIDGPLGGTGNAAGSGGIPGGGSGGDATGGGGSPTTGGGGSGNLGGGGSGSGSGGEGGGGSGTGGIGGTATGGGGAGGMGGGGAGGTGGTGGSGGTAGKAGAGGGGAGGNGGTGGKATGGTGGGGTGGGGGKACATGKLAITSASSDSVEAALTPNLAHDGNQGTRWSSAAGPQAWIYFDLGAVSHVSRVQIFWEAAHGIDYYIQISNASGGPWTDMLHVTNGDGNTDNLTNLTAADGRYVRMNGISHALGYGFSIYEFEIYGDPDETCQ
jgi:hypothetical protein